MNSSREKRKRKYNNYRTIQKPQNVCLPNDGNKCHPSKHFICGGDPRGGRRASEASPSPRHINHFACEPEYFSGDNRAFNFGKPHLQSRPCPGMPRRLRATNTKIQSCSKAPDSKLYLAEIKRPRGLASKQGQGHNYGIWMALRVPNKKNHLGIVIIIVFIRLNK